jgi:CheY-like chemotaxis protein
MKILIVDDDQNNLFTLESLIKEDIDTQLQIFKAESGQIALQILQQEQVDLIVLDVEMPEMNGFETAQIIRAQKETKDIPIVFITAAYDVEEFQEKRLYY